MIDSIGDGELTSKVGIFADDTRVINNITNENDALNLQNDLETLYQWSDKNNMAFNGSKFECLKMGTNMDLKLEYNYTTPDNDNAIEDVTSLRDLGIIVSDSGDYKDHIQKIVTKCKQRNGWISRAFTNKSVDFRRFMWRTYVQSLLDYGSQVWTPVDPTLIAHLESAQRTYTAQTEDLYKYNYWDRLSKMKLQSVQRRQERYRIIYLWKIMEGLVPNYGIKWTWDSKGRVLSIPKNNYKNTPIAIKMRDQSLIVHGGRIFNILPSALRNFTGTKETFKTKLDNFMTKIPDQPACPGLTPAPIDPITCNNSNSLYEWIRHLKLSDRIFYDIDASKKENGVYSSTTS